MVTQSARSAVTTTTPRVARSRFSRFVPLWMLLPTLLILLVLQLYPALYSVYLSFNRTQAGNLVWVGTRNYERLFKDARFIESLGTSVVFVGSYLALTLSIGMLIAVLLNQRVKLTPLFMVLLFIPWVVSDVVAGTMWRWLFQQDYGIIQQWLNPFTHNVSLYANPTGSMIIVILASVWRALPFTSLVFLGALQTVPREVLESAAIDGASRITSFTRITFPLIRPTFIVVTIFTTIGGLNAVGLILTLTGGGPGGATQTSGVYLYKIGWQFGDFGQGAAISVVLFVINLFATLFYLQFQRERTMR